MKSRTALAATALLCLTMAAPAAAAPTWRAAWGNALAGGVSVSQWSANPSMDGQASPGEATLRLVVRPTLSGSAIRIRLTNAASEPLRVAAASVGVRRGASGAGAEPGTMRPIRFGGSPAATVEPGKDLRSDPVDLPVKALQDLVVSLYVPEPTEQSVHAQSYVTQYVTASGAGNHTNDVDGSAFTGEQQPLPWLDGVEVLTEAPRSIVAIGDSITDGDQAFPPFNDDLMMNTYERWTDFVARRIHAEPGLEPAGLVNQGVNGDNAAGVLKRLQHDVLDLAGVTDVVVEIGTNDISGGNTPEQVIANLTEIATRLRAAGKRVIGATLVPRGTALRDADKAEVNRFIRTSPLFDGVLDLNRILARADDEDAWRPAYDSGDGIHPTPTGYAAIGEAFDLSPFRVTASPAGPCTRFLMLRAPRRLRRATISVGGKRVGVVRRGARRQVRLEAAPGRRVTVRLVGRTRAGRRVVATRRYLVCTVEKPVGGRIDPSNPRLRYEGRWDVNAGRATTVNSGSRIIMRFTGRAVTARFAHAGITSPPQIYAYLDGEKSERIVVDRDAIKLTRDDLPLGRHTLILAVKDVYENANRWEPPLQSALQFVGFELGDGATLDDPPPTPNLRFTFLGDSITQGVNLHCPNITSECADGTLDYAHRVAGAFGAGLEQVGFGAQGVTEGGGGNVPAASDALGFNFQGSPAAPWDADVVVINQGTNDSRAGADAVRTKYLEFLGKARHRYPRALIIALEPFGLGGVASNVSGPIQEAVEAMADPRVAFVSTRGWLGPPDFTESLHPNSAGHRKAALRLIETIASLAGVRPAGAWTVEPAGRPSGSASPRYVTGPPRGARRPRVAARMGGDHGTVTSLRCCCSPLSLPCLSVTTVRPSEPL